MATWYPGLPSCLKIVGGVGGGGGGSFLALPNILKREKPFERGWSPGCTVYYCLGISQVHANVRSKIYTLSALSRQRQALSTTQPNSSIVRHSLPLTISSPRYETRVSRYSPRSWRVFWRLVASGVRPANPKKLTASYAGQSRYDFLIG